jgi:hypothetical protein
VLSGFFGLKKSRAKLRESVLQVAWHMTMRQFRMIPNKKVFGDVHWEKKGES